MAENQNPLPNLNGLTFLKKNKVQPNGQIVCPKLL